MTGFKSGQALSGQGSGAAFQRAWQRLEASHPPPSHARDVTCIPFDSFAGQILDADEEAAARIAESLYAGSVIILKRALPLEFCRTIPQRIFAFGNSEESSFHKMLDGCPDYHRVIDPKATSAYSVRAVRHGYYFYRWNADPFGMFDPATVCWRIFKLLSGLAPDAFESSLPHDGVIDRIIFYQYPRGAGQLQTHRDPANNMKIIMGGLLSTRGVDFQTGGLYFVGPDGTQIDIEDRLEIGDFVIAYPSVHHGVAVIDEGAALDWGHDGGRWFLGLSTVDSDHVAERTTAEHVG